MGATTVSLGQLSSIQASLAGGNAMTWVGTWRNQYGSVLKITGDGDGLIKGSFKTALRDSSFFGHELPVTGIRFEDCITFAFGLTGEGPTSICSFTGMLRDNKLQTIWHVVTSATLGDGGTIRKVGWAHSVHTNVDTFQRVD
jgi:hypothetical protein